MFCLRHIITVTCLVAAICPFVARGQQRPGDSVDAQIAIARRLFDKGDAQGAKSAYQALLSEIGHTPASTQLAQVQNALSQISASEGDFEAAINFAREASQVYRSLRDQEGEAEALNNKGIAEIQRGLYRDAEADLQSAVNITRSSRQPKNEAKSLNNLGSAYFFQGKYFEASRSYQSAMTVVQNAASQQWSEYWRQITAFNQATLYQRLGRFEDALLIYREIERSSHSLTAGDRAHLYTNLGALYRRLGDPYKALETYQLALRLYSIQRDSDGEISVLKNIGIDYALDLRDFSKAQTMFQRALSVAGKTGNQREEMQEHLYLGESLLQQSRAQEALQEFQSALALSNKLGTTEEKWKCFYGIGRVKEDEGEDHVAETDYRQAIEIIEANRAQLQISALKAEFFADKREVYDALISLLLRNNAVSDAFLFLERSRARLFQDRLNSRSTTESVSPLTFDEVRNHLNGSTMLVEVWVGRGEMALLWSTNAAQGMTHKTLSRENQEQLSAFLRSMPESLSTQSGIMNEIFDIFPSPATGIHHLLIVPDGWSSFIPFDVLQMKGTPDMLIERYDITYLPTAALLRREAKDPFLRWPWQSELTAFGNPTLNSSAEDRSRFAVPALPYSGKEILQIAGLTRGRDELFLADRDLKSDFLSRSDDGWLLHVSTHAFADADNPENSRLLFASPRPGEGVDYLYLRELYELDLHKLQLATLSACDTERGKMVRGEGVQAFSRALLSAGSRSSLTTLWRVADEPTSEFMTQFYYFALSEHLPKAEALRQAKLRFLRSNSSTNNPATWAAFVLNGEGLTPVPRVVSWTTTLVVAAATLLIITFLLSRRFHRGQRP
jgi:CHAT domain-containing protein